MSINLGNVVAPSDLGRLDDIDRAKGLAILLVVFGHIVARQPPDENEWYVFAKLAVYSFHMAFFMFLSGVVFFARLRPVRGIPEFFHSVEKRFKRLMPAYFVFASIVFAGKLFAQQFGHVDNPVRGTYDFLNIALYPMQSISSFLWYIYALFVISVVALGVFSLMRGSFMALLVLGAALLFAPPIEFLAIGQIAKYFFFFAAGGFAISRWSSYVSLVDKLWIPAAGLMLFLIWMGWFSGEKWVVIAVLSVPALHGFCRNVAVESKILLYIGAMSFPIYLMNTMAIGVTKAVMFKFFSWHGINFFVFFPMLFLSGVLIPVLAKKYLITRFPLLDRITT